MSRPRRIEYLNARYHVMNCGRRSENMSLEESDFIRFKNVLKELSEIWKVNICAYRRMPNLYLKKIKSRKKKGTRNGSLLGLSNLHNGSTCPPFFPLGKSKADLTPSPRRHDFIYISTKNLDYFLCFIPFQESSIRTDKINRNRKIGCIIHFFLRFCFKHCISIVNFTCYSKIS